MNIPSFRFVLPGMFMLFLTGCMTAPPLQPDEMVPEKVEPKYQATNRSIKVNPVTGGGVDPRPSWMVAAPTIENDKFHQTLISALEKSNMFTVVSPTIDGDFTLKTEIIGQRMMGAYTNIMNFLVRYKLVETQTGKVLWKENILSQNFMTVSDVFMGIKRARLNAQGGAQKNIELLLDKLDHYARLPAGVPISSQVVTKKPKIIIEHKPAVIEEEPEQDSEFPRRLTGKEVGEHFGRHKSFIFDKVPKADFKMKIRPNGYVERDCPLCGETLGVGIMKIKESAAMVCFDWDQVSYPPSVCLEVIQIERDRYQLVDPVDGDTYGYRLGR